MKQSFNIFTALTAVKQIMISLFVLIIFVGNANSSILIKSPDGTIFSTKDSLEAARTAAEGAGKTVVVTASLTATQSNILSVWPTDRGLHIEKGGSLGNSTIFNANRMLTAGTYKVFAGNGEITGLDDGKIEWWGAGAGDNLTPIINKMIAAGIREITIPYNSAGYVLTTGIRIVSNLKLDGGGNTYTVSSVNKPANIFDGNNDTQKDNWTLRNFVVVSNLDRARARFKGLTSNLYAINFSKADNVRIENFRGSGMDHFIKMSGTPKRLITNVSLANIKISNSNMPVFGGYVTNLRGVNLDLQQTNSDTLDHCLYINTDCGNWVINGLVISGGVGAQVDIKTDDATKAPSKIVIKNITASDGSRVFAIPYVDGLTVTNLVAQKMTGLIMSVTANAKGYGAKNIVLDGFTVIGGCGGLIEGTLNGGTFPAVKTGTIRISNGVMNGGATGAYITPTGIENLIINNVVFNNVQDISSTNSVVKISKAFGKVTIMKCKIKYNTAMAAHVIDMRSVGQLVVDNCEFYNPNGTANRYIVFNLSGGHVIFTNNKFDSFFAGPYYSK